MIVSEVAQLGQLIRKRRKDLSLSLKDLSSIANVGYRFLWELEHGKSTVSFEHVLRVTTALGINIQADVR